MLGSGSKGQARCFYIATVALVVMLVEVAVFTFIPPVSRRIGPWAELGSLLIEKSEDVARTRRALGIPADRYLTLNEVKYIEGSSGFCLGRNTVCFVASSWYCPCGLLEEDARWTRRACMRRCWV